MKLKVFCDIADFSTIKIYNKKKIVDGFTTNPSLMKKAGAKDYKRYSKKILSVCKKKPISFEVFGDNHKEMVRQAEIINLWGKNVYVKIPIENSKGQFTGQTIRYLSKKKIKLNITAIYSVAQVKKVLRCLDKNTKNIISIFAGRMADKGINPVPIFKKSIILKKKFKRVEILWASTREAYNYIEAKKINCNIITMPPKIIDTIDNFGSSSKKLTLDTVRKFLKDSKKAKFKI